MFKLWMTGDLNVLCKQCRLNILADKLSWNLLFYRYEESRRGIKRPAEDRERREFFDDRKRPAPDNRSRFEDGPGPRRCVITKAI